MTKTNDIYWLNKDARLFLERGYLEPGVTPEERIRQIAETAETILKIKGFADKFESYMHKGWISLSSPVWSNFGLRALPISCFNSHIPDRMDGILEKVAEVGIMSKQGGGTSGYFGDLRPRGSEISTGGKTSGPVHFMELFESVSNVVSQGNVRRGSFAAYLSADSPDIEEFLDIRSEGHPIQHLSFGVCISDDFMKRVIAGDKVARKTWAKIIKRRFESGYPYIFFEGAANKNKPKVYKDKKYSIKSSNLCNEIMLPSTEDESFVCCLSSLNILHYDEWKDTDVIETLTYFLDAVMEEFIQKTANMKFMEAAHRFATRHRALGMGVLGWHSYLQSKMIPFESMEAKFLNTEIFKLLKEKSHKANKELAELFGSPELLEGYGLRNTTNIAIAPTTSSSFVLGQISPSIEPLHSNYFVKDLAKGKFTYKNPYLKEILKNIGKDTKDVWDSIMKYDGSVQHLDFLSELEKDVFKTFGEISQKEIVIQASVRQKYIDMGQSLNLMIHPNTPPKLVSELLIYGWEQQLKGLYYQRSTSPVQEYNRTLMSCASCEG